MTTAIKHPIFETGNAANWYTIIDGEFYYWNVHNKAWTRSSNEEGQNERRYAKAMASNKVFRVRLKGRITNHF